MKNFNLIFSVTIIVNLLLTPLSFAQTKLDLNDLSFKEIILPSEVEKMQKFAGAVYYNKSSKGKVLIPVHVWGQVSKPGLHFIPAQTSFISGLSMAGGPRDFSRLDNIKLIRKKDKDIDTLEFDLSTGGSQDAYFFSLKPNDTIFVERSTYYEDRAYYTSLISVFVTVLSGFVLYNQYQNQ